MVYLPGPPLCSDGVQTAPPSQRRVYRGYTRPLGRAWIPGYSWCEYESNKVLSKLLHDTGRTMSLITDPKSTAKPKPKPNPQVQALRPAPRLPTPTHTLPHPIQRLAAATAGVVVPPAVQQRLLPLPQQLLGLPTLLHPFVHLSSTDSSHHHLHSLPVDSLGGSRRKEDVSRGVVSSVLPLS